MGERFFRVLSANMTENTQIESVFVAKITFKSYISWHEIQKESRFNGDDSLSSKTFFAKQYNICNPSRV